MTAGARAQVLHERHDVHAGIPLRSGEFALFQKLVHEEAGIWLGPQKAALVRARLARRLRELQLGSYGEYYEVVRERGDAELAVLLDCIATNETRFFREPRHFEFLGGQVLPRWREEAARGTRTRTLRVWSAACSTGEEPYSLAMLLLDQLDPADGWNVEILASDISTRALDAARRGIWPMSRVADVPRGFLERFMLRGRRSQEGNVSAGPELRSVIRFERLNLNDLAGANPGAFDLVFCRNVMIYFDAATKQRVVASLLGHLAPTGYLFIGHAETLNGVSEAVRAVIPTVYGWRTTPRAAASTSRAP